MARPMIRVSEDMSVANGDRGADTTTTTLTTTLTTSQATSSPGEVAKRLVLSFSLSALCLFAGAVVPSSSYAEPAGAYQQEYQYQGQGEAQYRAPPASAYAQMQAKAQPFQKVEVNKGRVWLLFVLGASSLFGVTVLVENNSAWFPAISRANKAMKAGMAAIEEKERLERLEREMVGTGLVEVVGRGEGGEEEMQSMQSTQDAVLAGLRAASANAKETMRGVKEMEVAADEEDEEDEVVVGSRPTMIPLELSADDGDEIAVDVVDMSRGSSVDEDDAWDDIGSLLDEPIPGAEEGGEDENGEAVVGVQPEEQQPEEAEQRKPLFEISGEAIDASISSRAAQFQEELEKASASNGVAADGVDLSGISLEDLQAELQKRNSTQ